MGPPYGKRDPYYSHIFRDSYGNGMGIGPRAQGDPLLVPENPTEYRDVLQPRETSCQKIFNFNMFRSPIYLGHIIKKLETRY